MLTDGSYDAMVLEVLERKDSAIVTLTITDGEHMGGVVDITARAVTDEEFVSWIGMPCTLVVDGGKPRIVWQG